MSYDPKNLSILAYANGFTLWHYTTTDTATKVDTAGYFNGAAESLRRGDMILTNTDAAGTRAGGFFLCTANTGGGVDIMSMTSHSD